jgi:hypothetical protein
VTSPLIEFTTVHGAAPPLSDESLVLAGGDPVQSVTPGVVKPWRLHPAFAPRPAQPKIVESASTSAKTWRSHPAFASRAQPMSVKSSPVDSALTIKQASEVADPAPPVKWLTAAYRPPEPTHNSPCPFCVRVVPSIPWPSFLPPRYRCTRSN